MITSYYHRQTDISFIQSSMLSKKEVKKIHGNNLKRLRNARGLTQDALGALLKKPVNGSHIASIESGKGVSDELLARLCNALHVGLWEFTWTEEAPIVKDEHEQEGLFRLRRAQAAGVAENAAKYGEYLIKEKESEDEGAGRPAPGILLKEELLQNREKLKRLARGHEKPKKPQRQKKPA